MVQAVHDLLALSEDMHMPLCEKHAQEHAEREYLAMVDGANAVVKFWRAIVWLALLVVIGCGIAQIVIGEHVFQLTIIMLVSLALMITGAMYVCGFHIPLQVGDVLYRRKKAEQEKGIY